MKRLTAAFVTALLLSGGVAHAILPDDTQPGPFGSTWSHPKPERASTLTSAKQGVCTPKRCKIRMSCVGNEFGDPCLFIAGVLSHGTYLTWKTESVVDPENPEPNPLPVSPPISLWPGKSKTVTMRVLFLPGNPYVGKAKILKLLERGKKWLPDANWEANRLGFVDVTEEGASRPTFETLYQYGEVPFRIRK